MQPYSYMNFKPGRSLVWVLLLFCWTGFMGTMNAQRTVTGSIRDQATLEPLPGAAVAVKNTARGTVTDADGKFSLQLENADAELMVTYTGYKDLIVDVRNKSSLDLMLEEDAVALGEVVVTALGITKEKARVGYAVQDVKGDDLIKAREPNPINSLVGKVAGLTVGVSAELLGSPGVLLRGQKPLFVVDGIPIQSDSYNINPDDIESITVLKGPNAAALYGFRGQNGAIQIVTKRGTKDGRGFSVEFNTSQMMDATFLTIPKVQYEYGPGDHGRYYFVDGKGSDGNSYDADYDIWGPKFEGQLITQYDSPIDPATGKRTPTPWVARGKDNLERFLRPGFLSTNNIAIASRGEKYDLRFSGTYLYQQGIVPNSQLNGGNFNITAGYDFTKKLRFETGINYNRQFTDNYPDVQYGPNSMIYNIIIWGGADWDVDDMKNYWQPGREGIQQIYAEYTRYNNPWFLAKEWLRGHYRTDVYGYTSLKYQFSDALSLQGRTQITTYDLFRNEKFPYSATVYGREQAKGDYREDRRNLYESNTELLLNFNKDVSSSLNVAASLGGNIRNMNYNSTYATTDYLNVPGWYSLNNSLNPRRVANFAADMSVLSAYGYVDLTYNRYLTLGLTGRADKNSSVNTTNNTYFYPSASLSAIVSDMMRMPGWLTFLKLRGSYAYVGSGQTQSTIGPAANYLDYGSTFQTPYDGPTYENQAAYSVSQPSPYLNTPGAYYTTVLANPNLKPSFTSAYEAGIDMRFLNNRVGLDFTYFNALNGPFIFNLPLSSATGYSSARENGIKTRKTGVEVVLNVKPVRKNNFTWDVDLNWSTFQEKLVEIYPGVDVLNQFLKVGDRVDAYYARTYAKTADGQIINDAGGRPIIRPISQFLGYLNPDWAWGINNKFRVGNLSFNFQLDGRVGGVIVNYIRRQTFRGGRNIETTEGAMGEARYQDYKGVKSWLGEGVQIVGDGKLEYDVDGNITNLSSLSFKPNETKTFLQDWISRYYSAEEGNLMSRTFMKLREVTVTYHFPASWTSGKFIKEGSISFVGRNLLYFAEHSDVDLDQFTGIQTGGYSSLQSPTLRRFGLNLNLKF